MTVAWTETLIETIYLYIYSDKNYFGVGIRYPDNCSRLVPDSRNNFFHYFALLSIEHFFALVA